MEKNRLLSANRMDLAANVSKVADWQGYDIMSFHEDGSKKYIEVKTTPGGKYRPFVFTRNEKNFMLEKKSAYFLYRIYDFNLKTKTGQYFILQGDFSDRVLEEPLQFNIHLKSS